LKVFQTIHKYPPHIPQFEASHGITDESKLTFAELQKMVVDDGYASSYILQPALEHRFDEVFYTIWDYERLQLLWAKENGLSTTGLVEIKFAQLKWFQPDVFYNMSPFCDDQFIEFVKLDGIKCKTVCWNGIIQSRPMTFPLYDIHLTLHRPYIDYWKGIGLNAFELQPGIPGKWGNINDSRDIDVLFYGQYFKGMFDNRNAIIDELIKLKPDLKANIQVYLQYNVQRKTIVRLPKINISIKTFPIKEIRQGSNKPIYGNELYRTISDSKIVVNAYTNDNKDFKSNMRVFEALGNGAFLISERGNYPDGLEPDIDFYTYEGFDELKEKIGIVLGDWQRHAEIAKRTSEKARAYFSKEKQWQRFQEIVASL
jgi:hypothetical protein